MDKFDRQIAMLKPAPTPFKLDERQFMKKLKAVKYMQRQRRRSLWILILTVVTIFVGAFSRNIVEVVVLTLRYIADLPALFNAFLQAYIATISWPNIVSILLVVSVGIMLVRQRSSLPTLRDRKLYNYASLAGFAALAFGLLGLFGGSGHALAQQEALRRSLNERGHLEVRVDGKAYELYAQSGASDASLRNQATIERLRDFDISAAYPELKSLNHDGFVTEIRAVNPKDDCVYYVERRLESGLDKVIDANSGCIRSNSDRQTYYLSSQLKPIKAPKWKIGQTAYLSYAKKKDTGLGVDVVILLAGKADDYIAKQSSEKLVPEGQQAAGVQSCGIDAQDICPEVGGIDLLMNAEQPLTGGMGSAIAVNSLSPQADAQIVRFFGKITVLDDRRLQVELINGKPLTIAWPRNYIADFNAAGAKHYKMVDGPLVVGVGDYVMMDVYYKDDMDLQRLSMRDTGYIMLALKTTLPDPLSGEKYNKAKAMEKTEKYRP